MNLVVDSNVVAKEDGHLNTPSKELPPSLGFGSSSSPGIDSSPSLHRSYDWKSSLAPAYGGLVAKGPMPSKIPSLVLFGNSKASKDSINDASFEFSRGLEDSLNELTDDVVSSARLLPADFPHSVSDEITIENLESSPPISTRTLRSNLPSKKSNGSPRPSVANLVENQARKTITVDSSISEDEQTVYDSEKPENVGQNVHQRKRNRAGSAVINTLADQSEAKTDSPDASMAKRRKSISSSLHAVGSNSPIYAIPSASQTAAYTASNKISVYAAIKTESGLPLVSGKAFRKICGLQSFKSKSDLRSTSLEYSDREQHHYTTQGRRLFDFGINARGCACISPNKPVDPQYYGLPSKEQPPLQITDILDEDSDSESEDECEPRDELLPDLLKTPQKFSTLGSYDAVTEFARTLGRSHHNGFMFSSPNDHESSDINEPMEPHITTPQTPKMTQKFNKSLFNLQMRTPPGAIFSSYDYQMGNFATGMTPFINRLQ